MIKSETRSLSLTIGQCATFACLLEVNAPKPGNVHRGADFDDAALNDFAAGAVAIGPPMDRAATQGVGQTVLQAVAATRQVAKTNTNLGTILLLAPLSCVPDSAADLASGVRQVLSALGPSDADEVYRAIRLASPGGLGNAPAMDVAEAPPADLLVAMRAAADRDLVARQYANGYHEVFHEAVPSVVAGRASGWPLPLAIVHAHVQLMARHGDSLIARKCGEAASRQCAARAQRVLDSGSPEEEAYHGALADLDFWLRNDGRRRNPGTTADLLATALFVCLRQEMIGPPWG